RAVRLRRVVRFLGPRAGGVETPFAARCAGNGRRMPTERHVHFGGLVAVFWGLFGLFLARNRPKLPERLPTSDILRIALATHKMSRLIAKDEVTEFIRAPFTEDPEGTEPKRRGLPHAVGTMITCPYCVGLWVASGFSS